jgi:hypothetical protein
MIVWLRQSFLQKRLICDLLRDWRKTPENSKITKKLLESCTFDTVHSTGTHLELHMGNWRI